MRDLKQKYEYYRLLSEATFEAIFLSDKGVCLGQNSTARKMFGYSDEEALHMSSGNTSNVGISAKASEARCARLPARIKCPDCHHEFILAFSCRGRWFPESRSSLTSRHAITRK